MKYQFKELIKKIGQIGSLKEIYCSCEVLGISK